MQMWRKKEISQRADMMNEGERNARNKLNYVSTAEHNDENKKRGFSSTKTRENGEIMK